MNQKFYTISSLEKIFYDENLEQLKEIHQLSSLKDEIVSFQIAYDNVEENTKINVICTKEVKVCTKQVKCVPCNITCNKEEMDEYYLRTEEKEFPDVLSEIENGIMAPAYAKSMCIWVDLEISKECSGGIYDVVIEITKDSNILFTKIIKLDVIGYVLPKQRIIHTEWFHADCLADYYQVEPLSEEHFTIMDNFIKCYVKCGMNMILTPIFTPPLDTIEHGERTTVQLVDIKIENGTYVFSYDKLLKFINMCRKNGIEYFEMMHLFTQWGAKHAPKIMAYKGKEYVKIFGWDTDASGEEYGEFLKCFLTSLTLKLKEWELENCVWFHLSDEPSKEDITYYRKARSKVEEYLNGFPIMDALSDYEFYKEGLTSMPIPGTNHIQDFLDKGIDNLWTYYCSAQKVKVSNRFFAMPLARVRILGVQLYKFSIKGFLHWGFNFYNSQYSKCHINPYKVTDAAGAFPGGDSFIIYPKEGGVPEESIRMMALRQAFYDIRALYLLEELKGREFVISLINKDLEKELTFEEYPRDQEYLLSLREQVNQMIKE